MQHRELHYRWEWQLRASPQQLWPLVSDTNRFDRDTGLPAYEEEDVEGSGARGRHRVRVRMYGVPIEWTEEPFEWVQPYRFGVLRRYEAGVIPFVQPLAESRLQVELQPLPDGGTHLTYDVWMRPRNLFGYLAIPIQMGLISARRFDAAFRHYDELIAAGESIIEEPARHVRFAPGGRERLVALRQSLLQQGADPVLLDRLVALIEEGDDLALDRIRPYALADFWSLPRRDVLELCLMATRVGLLDFQWDLLCPLCRVAKESVARLGDVNRQIHCNTCNIDYTANFDRSVELTFRPNPAVRQVEEQLEFCTTGPQATPHVAVQQVLPPGASRVATPELELGRYRLRTLELPGGHFLRATAGGQEEATLQARSEGWPHDELLLSLTPTLTLANSTDREMLFVLERLAWTDQAATAAEVTALQRFRDLFANEALRPGDQIQVGSLTILFTDLCESTRLYQEIGDAPAFGLVMDHFDVLRQAIQAEEGAMVKTIGDAVMAVFRRPVSALRAMMVAQQQLISPPPGRRPLHLKAALHYGPSIAVTLNGRLDYFGSTVNVASRLEKFAGGGEIVLSDTVHADPEVRDFLVEQERHYLVESFEKTLRGFDEDCFCLWRVKMRLEIEELEVGG